MSSVSLVSIEVTVRDYHFDAMSLAFHNALMNLRLHQLDPELCESVPHILFSIVVSLGKCWRTTKCLGQVYGRISEGFPIVVCEGSQHLTISGTSTNFEIFKVDHSIDTF